MSKTPIRCAVYTRKSSEEGLEQSFNSLNAQREACEAFIASQKHEGWVLIKTHYDDGGFSGGTMERPALKHLLEDVGGGKVNTVVVYKIDRLTRSLLDFSKIVEAFDAKGVSFVSVTQQFNTTTSMGRLTLNILLSFAQFEREITGERIRDKFAASKKKGMWMGGAVPFGYRLENRQLIIVPGEAELLRDIYRQYLKLGSVSAVCDYLDSKQLRTRTRNLFSRGALYHLLGSRLYAGEIAHRGQIYPGQHEAIIDAETWNAVAEHLRSNAPRRSQPRTTTPSLLTGLVFDTAGVRYTPTHAVKRGKRYRYYTSQSVIQHREVAGIARLPAGELEDVVIGRVKALLGSSEEVICLLEVGNDKSVRSVLRSKVKAWSKLTATDWIHLVKNLLRRVTVGRELVEIGISSDALKAFVGSEENVDDSQDERLVQLVTRIHVRNHGGETRIISESGEPIQNVPSASLIMAIIRARKWYDQIIRGEVASFEELAEQEAVTAPYVRRVFRYVSLSPALVQDFLNGRTVMKSAVELGNAIPTDWVQQSLNGWS
jgi:DNA invertase Pin-like site-specific DNA recombinase